MKSTTVLGRKRKNDQQVTRWQCVNCMLTFTTKQALQYHEKNAVCSAPKNPLGTEEEVLKQLHKAKQCMICRRQFSAHQQLMRHAHDRVCELREGRQVVNTRALPTRTSLWKCNLCNFWLRGEPYVCWTYQGIVPSNTMIFHADYCIGVEELRRLKEEDKWRRWDEYTGQESINVNRVAKHISHKHPLFRIGLAHATHRLNEIPASLHMTPLLYSEYVRVVRRGLTSDHRGYLYDHVVERVASFLSEPIYLFALSLVTRLIAQETKKRPGERMREEAEAEYARKTKKRKAALFLSATTCSKKATA